MTTTTSLINLPRTVLGPLTSTFTAPASCAYLGVQYVGDELVGWRGQGCDSSEGQIDNQACWPQTTAGAVYPATPFSGWGFYSPGLACPAGHTSACTATASGSADWAVQFELEAGETAVGCCPTGYACTNHVTESGQTCYLLASSTAITTAVCDGSTFAAGVLTMPSVEAATSTLTSMNAWAPMIQINWKASDRAGSAVASTSTSTATGSTSTPTSTGASSTFTSSNAGDRRNAEIIVGIVIGVVAGLAALAAAGFFLWRRRMAPQLERAQIGAEPWREGKYANAQELADPGEGAIKSYGELPTREGNVHEMSDRGKFDASELPG